MASQETTSFIVVMGATGSGKSTFINLVSGSTLAVSDGLRSCTSEVQESMPFVLDDQAVVMVDTPGFDDTTRPDTDIITVTSKHLVRMYQQGARLAGVVYMHRISDVRIGGTSLLNFRVFCALCGDEGLRNAIIVTTMWSDVEHEVGESRERELTTAEDLFKPALDCGARVVRHDGTPASARTVLRRLIASSGAAGTTLRIQRELADEGKDLLGTAAGAELARLYAVQARRLDERGKKLYKQLEAASRARDERGWAAFRLELEETEREKRRVEDEDRRLRGATTGLVPDHAGVPAAPELRDGLPTATRARTMLQEQLNDVHRARKYTKNESERLLQHNANTMSEVLRQLKSRSVELRVGLQVRSRSDALDTVEDGPVRVRPADQALEEVQRLQRQIDVAMENQEILLAEVRKCQEENRRSVFDRMVAWFMSSL